MCPFTIANCRPMLFVLQGILQVSDSSGDGKIDKKEWFQYFGV